MIRDFVYSKDCSSHWREKYNEAKQASEGAKNASNRVKAEKQFKDKKIFEAANLGHPEAMKEMAIKHLWGDDDNFEIDYDKGFAFATIQI